MHVGAGRVGLQGRRDASGAEATAPIERGVLALLEQVQAADLAPQCGMRWRRAFGLCCRSRVPPGEALAAGVKAPAPRGRRPVGARGHPCWPVA